MDNMDSSKMKSICARCKKRRGYHRIVYRRELRPLCRTCYNIVEKGQYARAKEEIRRLNRGCGTT